MHLTNQINACYMHLKRNEFDPFLKRILTGDEKRIVYNNVSQNDHGSSTMKRHKLLQRLIFTKKRLLWVWWAWKDVVYIELLSSNQTINSDVYCQHLDKLYGLQREATRIDQSYFIRTTLDRIHLWSLAKNWVSLVGNFASTI